MANKKNHAKQNKWSRILAQFSSGMVGGIVLGVIALLNLATYGGQNGCFPIINDLMNMTGYESCGAFGGLSGVIIGSLIGISLVWGTRWKENTYRKLALFSSIGIIVVPYLMGIVMFGFENSPIFFPVILIFMFLALIPSAILTVLFNRSSFFREEEQKRKKK